MDATRSPAAPSSATPQGTQREGVPPVRPTGWIDASDAPSVSPPRPIESRGLWVAAPGTPSGTPGHFAPSGTPYGSPLSLSSAGPPDAAQGRDGKDTLVSAPWFEERAPTAPAGPEAPEPAGPGPAQLAMALFGTVMFVSFVAVVLWFAVT